MLCKLLLYVYNKYIKGVKFDKIHPKTQNFLNFASKSCHAADGIVFGGEK